jgi:ABC-type molybdenum transport system ATPase subunit/photorepair protein PhrA
MMTHQNRRDDAPGLKEAGEASISAGTPAAEVTHLRKSYGSVVAVDDVSFSVAEGEIFGILGPNGAGKTTTVECVIGPSVQLARGVQGRGFMVGRRSTVRFCNGALHQPAKMAPHQRERGGGPLSFSGWLRLIPAGYGWLRPIRARNP